MLERSADVFCGRRNREDGHGSSFSFRNAQSLRLHRVPFTVGFDDAVYPSFIPEPLLGVFFMLPSFWRSVRRRNAQTLNPF